ncbi:MAG: hypothetical protein AAGC78_14620 [Cellvibrio sp.]|uniref:hypothetical protein n=1 Tax=Cellvibrio sp. TaxID=1965322 RepID=UPI0031A1C173
MPFKINSNTPVKIRLSSNKADQDLARLHQINALNFKIAPLMNIICHFNLATLAALQSER